MKISQLRSLAQSDRHAMLSEIRKNINQALADEGYDLTLIYQEIEMDSLFVDSHDDLSLPGDVVQLHSHSFYELLYCRSSGSEYLLGPKRYRVRKGDVIYIPPGISHRPLFLEHLAEPYTRYVIWLSPEYASHLMDSFPGQQLLPDTPFLLSTMGTAWEELGARFRAGVQEAQRGEEGWQAALCAGTLQILVHLMRARKNEVALSPPEEKMELLDELLLYIEKHMSEKITLADTAHRFLVSESSISQLFRKRLKVSFYRFVTQRRLISAKTLILEGVPAEQAGAQVGFGDYSTFFRAFKREYGLSPTEYRKLMEEPLPDAQILPDA